MNAFASHMHAFTPCTCSIKPCMSARTPCMLSIEPRMWAMHHTCAPLSLTCMSRHHEKVMHVLYWAMSMHPSLVLVCILLFYTMYMLSHACIPWHQAHILLNVSLVALFNWDHKSNIICFFLAWLTRVWTIKSIDCLVDKSILPIVNAV